MIQVKLTSTILTLGVFASAVFLVGNNEIDLASLPKHVQRLVT